MGNRSITTDLPSTSRVYVFGSALTSDTPQDIDILILYEPMIFHPSVAYDAHANFVAQVGSHTGLSVDITLLTFDEELSCNFIETEGAVPLEF